MADTGAALIVGVGRGLSASLARLLNREGMKVGLAARDAGKLGPLARETGAETFSCDASDAGAVQDLFADAEARLGPLGLVVYNASDRGGRGPVETLDAAAVRKALMITAFGGFLVAQEAAKRMLPRGFGSILLTGASASVKGYANSSSFALGKFGLRGVAQALARELAPRNIHVAHFVIDGGIRQGDDDPRIARRGEDGLLHPDAIAETYLHVHRQSRTAWTWEVELRPWDETF